MELKLIESCSCWKVLSLLRRIIFFAAFYFATFDGLLLAQTETEYWPEMQFYHRLNPQFRIRGVAGITRSQPFEGASDGFVRGDLDIGLKNIVRRKLEPDAHKGKYLSMRLGYSYHSSLSGENRPPEHRGILEVTARAPLLANFLLSETNRIDFRSIGDLSSKRYRNRIRLECASAIRGLAFSPYGVAEFYYDTRVDGWNRNEYSFGSEFPIRKRFVLEFYYTYQKNRGLGFTDVNGLGTVFQWYW